MNAPTASVGESVLEFYKTLPFNMRSSAEGEAEIIRATNIVDESYPILGEHLKPGSTVLEVGCGVGWLSNSISLHYGCAVTGLDFNAVATDRAKQTAAVLGVETKFVTGDFYTYEAPPYDVVVSNGVLHHTHDCMLGVERLLTKFVAPGGVALIGLYHLYGRRPFLQHFEDMRAAGATEDQMLDRYAELHPQLANDRQHLLSWYRDQVCHPFETQHTLAEMMPLLEKAGMTLVSTSINRFQPFESHEELFAAEPGLHDVGVQRLQANQYYPGFYLFLARKDR